MFVQVDLVNQPPHYTSGTLEVIDVIEDTICHAPAPALGYLQGQTLKYLLRMWNKGADLQDAKKARWYLDRLIGKLEGVD
jgi:hypothetical protein